MKRKFILAFLFFVCCSSTIFSQTNNWLWAKTTDGTSDGGKGTSVCTDTAGNVFIAGWFYSWQITFGSTVMHNVTSNNRGDIFIAKYDRNGNVLWARSAGGPKDDLAYSVCTDVAGNVFVTGIFNSANIAFGTTILHNADNSGTTSDVFIAKYDTNGNLLWAQSAVGSLNDEAWSVSTDAAGNAYLTGDYLSYFISFGSIPLTNINPTGNNSDIFITKYDPNGNVIWAKTAGSTGIDVSCSASTDPSGNVFITGAFGGTTINFGSTTLTNPGAGSSLFVAKYDVNGNVLWAKNAGTHGDQGYSVSADPVGNVYVTGYFYSSTLTFGNTTLNNADVLGNSSDVFIAKYDPNGNVIWAKRAGGTCNNNDVGWSVSADSTGHFYVTGLFPCQTIDFGAIVLNTPPTNFSDPMFVVEYDSSGTALCASALPSGGVYQHGISADLFGNAYVCSDFEIDTLFVGADTLLQTGGFNILLAKYNCNGNPQAVNEIGNETNFSIFPNPSNGIFTLKWDGGQGTGDKGKNCIVEIYNSLGEIVYQSKINSSTSKIDLSNEANGIYFVNVKVGEKSFSQKIIIE